MLHFISNSAATHFSNENFILTASSKNKINMLIFGFGRIGKELRAFLQRDERYRFVGFVDRNASHCQSSDPVFAPESVRNLDFDAIIISSYMFQDEMCRMLLRFGVEESKIIRLKKEDFDPPANATYPAYEWQCNPDETCEAIAGSFGQAQGQRDFRTRCLPESQRLSDLLLLHIDFQRSQKAYHIIDEAGRYTGSISMVQLSELPQDMRLKNPALSEIRDWLEGITSIDRGISIHMPLRDVLGCLQETHWNELPVLDDDTKIAFGIDAWQFSARCLRAAFPADGGPVSMFHLSHHCDMRWQYQLNRYAYNVFSQSGEDGILEEIFNRIGFQSKTAIEFGAWDGVYLSNIRNLILKHGFSGIFIEGDPDRAHTGSENYRNFPNVQFLQGYVGFDRLKNLDDYLKEANAPQAPDLLSIDIDGYEYHVWDSLQEFRPRVVIIEFNPTMSNEVLFINPKNEDCRIGSSCTAMVDLGLRKGYSLAAVSAGNAIFVADEEFAKLGIRENSLDNLRPRESYVPNLWMQTYNRQIYSLGMDTFTWSGEKFISNRFIIPQNQ